MRIEQKVGATTVALEFERDYDDVRSGDSYQTIDTLIKSLGHEDTFIDCGAHIGFISVPVAAVAKPKLVVAFEPVPRFRKMLEQNLKENVQSPYVIESRPLWSADGEEIDFYESNAQSSFINRGQGIENTLKLKTITIDTIVKELSITGPIVMKIDVELAEPQLLTGAVKSMPQIKLMIIEMLPNVMKWDLHFRSE